MSLYSVAGLTVSMSPHHALTASRAEAYRIHSGSPLFHLECGGDQYEEYAELARAFYEQLLDFDGFLLHASAVELDGRAVAFSAASGTGKSTHSAFWRKELGAQIINDDKPAIRLINGEFCACGTPFSGKAGLSRAVCVPLEAIVFLTRSEDTWVKPLKPEDVLYRLLSQTLRPSNASAYDRLFSLLEQLLATVNVFEAGVPNDASSASIVWKAIHHK